MERQIDTDRSSSPDYAQRSGEFLMLQKTFMMKEFLPRCMEIGMDRMHVDKLLSKFFMGIGDIYRQTDITPERFGRALQVISDRLLADADKHKYFLSEGGADVGWDATVDSICSVERLSEVQIDYSEKRAYHDVYFPVARSVDPEHEGRRIRTVIHLDSPESEQIVEDVDLSELSARLRRRMGGILTNR